MADSSSSSLSSSSSMSTTGSSPIKKASAAYASHIRSEVEKVLEPKIEVVNVDDFWKSLGYSKKEFPYADQHVKNAGIHTMEHMNDKVFSGCLNKLSAHVHTLLRLGPDEEIQFFVTPNTTPKDHPTGTLCRPDIIATTQRGEIHWTGIEATVEVHSSGRTEEGAGLQAASYSIFLLQARPDLLAVQGFCVTKSGIILTIASSSGVTKTKALNMSVSANRVLLYAFVTRLYEPDPNMVDPSIKRRWDDTAPQPHYVFDITLTPADGDPVVCSGYRTVYARESLGQRAHIFVNEINPTSFRGAAIPVIKDAYCDLNCRFTEDAIIKHIHHEGDIPGIVRVAYAELVCYEGPDRRVIVRDGRQKTRLCLTEFGRSIMECKTVKDVLIVMYDQLESTRVMHRNRNVIHRDISIGNIMFRDLPVPPPSEDCTVETVSGANTDSDSETKDPPAVFCGGTYLLGETDDPRFTKNLLIDLERAEVLTQKLDDLRMPRTGTVRFMARSIRGGRVLGDSDIPLLFKSPPEISETLLTRYGGILPDRVKRFACKTSKHSPDYTENPSGTIARHALRHDAESVFWVLVWWAVCAAPAGKASSEVHQDLWRNLTGNDRDFRPTRIVESELDPSYDALRNLINPMASYLIHDLHWATETPFNHPEFLHESFQRLILNFLVDNKDEDFMVLPTSGKPRESKQLAHYGEPVRSRQQHLLDTSSAGGSSLKRPASSQGELERAAKKSAGSVASGFVGVMTRLRKSKRG
ncbi:hypothetical protein HYPSUDRAFT_49539 [Hypholoma sublateritium FD-334 SS-4]|uniref:Fungal-type protein kinase domain-containing protein n=1 Tax=Hypholoma sublateritium (strain FD-334 SS-4) TaxID=945553 RepID=A0A0D2NBI2_HYPSF|nr:hypothetical protein HYPSUDRAFT_49539 [Hypholoma sublateritium FD-334 SS-4]